MNILVTGGSGFIGQLLTGKLIEQGHKPRILSRSEKDSAEISSFKWNEEWVDPEALNNVDVLVHLAGANVGAKLWTERRKRELMDSRVRSLELLYNQLKTSDQFPKRLISASAVGFYGDRGMEDLSEKSAAGDGFLAELCKAWEEAAWRFTDLGTDVQIFRIGVVLHPHYGALPQMVKTHKFGLAVQLGAGYFPWIHYEDVVKALAAGISGTLKGGIFNLTAPDPVTYSDFFKSVRKAAFPVSIPINVPATPMKWILGEMSSLFLSSQKVRPGALLENGFNFSFQHIDDTLQDIYRKD